MFTNYMLVQKIGDNGEFFQYCSEKTDFIWDFIERKQISSDKAEIFPMAINGKNVKFTKYRKTCETKLLFNSTRKSFTYNENYSVPGGFVIAIVFPKNFIPVSLGFGEKAMIQSGGKVGSDSPGSFDVLYNKVEKITTIVFSIVKNTNFQFSCCGVWTKDEFPSSMNNFNSDIDAVISMNSERNRAIEEKDLQVFKDYFKDDTKLSDIAKQLNVLANSVSDKRDKDLGINQKEIMGKIEKTFSDKLSTTSNVITLMDSYLNDGIVAKLIAALLMLIRFTFM